MKTSPKTSPKISVALLAILALGGSTAGSLFSESLQTNVISTIGSAGIFFPDSTMQTPIQQAITPSNGSKSEADSGVIALPIEASTVTPAPIVETQVRAITNLDTSPSSVPTITPEPAASPEASIKPSPTPEASPEVSASQLPEPSFEPSIAPFLPE